MAAFRCSGGPCWEWLRPLYCFWLSLYTVLSDHFFLSPTMNGERLVIEEPGFLPGDHNFFGGKDQVRVARHGRNRCVKTSFQSAVCVDVAMAIIREFLWISKAG